MEFVNDGTGSFTLWVRVFRKKNIWVGCLGGTVNCIARDPRGISSLAAIYGLDV